MAAVVQIALESFDDIRREKPTGGGGDFGGAVRARAAAAQKKRRRVFGANRFQFAQKVFVVRHVGEVLPFDRGEIVDQRLPDIAPFGFGADIDKARARIGAQNLERLRRRGGGGVRKIVSRARRQAAAAAGRAAGGNGMDEESDMAARRRLRAQKTGADGSVGRQGLEPWTNGLKVRCSTD